MNPLTLALALAHTLFLRGPGLAINHSTTDDSLVALGTAANVAPIEQGEEWNMIAPYGEFPNPLGLQVVNRQYAERVVANFNSVFAKLGRLFRGVPIYRGHPDVMPDRWPDDKRYGRYDALEARDDGLYAKPAWNSAGQENVKEGYYVYPSVAWHFEDIGQGRIAPTSLVSVGLTNTPNIPSVRPLTNTRPSNQNEQVMLKKIAEKFGLNADAPEDQIIAAINALMKKVDDADAKLVVINASEAEAKSNLVAANTTRTTLETEVATAKAELKKFRDQARDLLTGAAINDGRLTAAELPAFNTKFDADFTAAQTELAAKQPALNTKQLNLQRSAHGDLSTARARQVAFNARIDELMATGLQLDAAIAKMKSTPADAELLKAMEPAAAA